MGTIASLQAAIGYRRAQEREGCANCVHVLYDRDAYARGERYGLWRCAPHGFGTAPLAICSDYTAREPGGKEPQS